MKIYTNTDAITYESLVFSGGEVQVKLTSHPIGFEYITIEALVTNSKELMELILVTDALRRQYAYQNPKIRLKLPYLPYARQDRVCYRGEALSIKPFCDIINLQNYESVEVWDAHSDVSLALLNNVINVHQSSLLYLVPKTNAVLVSPDAGAFKKTLECSKAYSLPMVRADKIRNPETGEITSTTIYSEHIGYRNFLIVDDLCDGGATYVGYTKSDKSVVPGLVQALRPLTNGRIHLYVTHGIFSKGLEPLLKHIDHIFTPNPFPNVPKHDRLTVLKGFHDV